MDLNRSLWDVYSIPVSILFLLITTGGFTGNNGFTGDFGLDYCNDKDNSVLEHPTAYTEQAGLTESEIVHSKSFFACELGYVNGVVDLGWSISSFTYGSEPQFQTLGVGRAMILNHENYKNFVEGEIYGFSNFHLSKLESSLEPQGMSMYETGITLHSDTYFFVVDRGYGNTGPPNNANISTNRGLVGPNSPTGSTDNPIYFDYVVDLDYDTSGVITTN